MLEQNMKLNIKIKSKIRTKICKEITGIVLVMMSYSAPLSVIPWLESPSSTPLLTLAPPRSFDSSFLGLPFRFKPPSPLPQPFSPRFAFLTNFPSMRPTVSMQNILETQVSDLSSLADSPIPLPLVPAAYAMVDRLRAQESAESPARDAKRKSEDTGAQNGAQPRAKRNRYISIAW